MCLVHENVTTYHTKYVRHPMSIDNITGTKGILLLDTSILNKINFVKGNLFQCPGQYGETLRVYMLQSNLDCD